MVRWIGHAMYAPQLRALVWTLYPRVAPEWDKWASGAPGCVHARERGLLIHALPWGTPGLTKAWVSLVVSSSAMGAFRRVDDHGLGLVHTINHEFLTSKSTPAKGSTTDFEAVLGNTLYGMEIKSGRWENGASWTPQIKRYLSVYPSVVVACVSPDAALGRTPTFIICTS